MFSYTDDAIVTSSPTGRHLSTVIRRPAGMPDDQWRKHADQVCTVLNELDSKAKANSLSLHLQTVGRVKRIAADRDTYIEELRSMYGGRTPLSFGAVPPAGPTFAELIDAGYLAPSHRHMRTEAQPRNPVETCVLLEQRIAELEKQLDDATTKLCAAQMLLEKPIEVTEQLAALLYHMPKGATAPFNNRTFKRVE